MLILLPIAGNSTSTVTHAKDFTGLRFSDKIIAMTLMIVIEYIINKVQYIQEKSMNSVMVFSIV